MKNPWNCQCWDCAGHFNAASTLQEARSRRTYDMEELVRKSQELSRRDILDARVSWRIDALRASVNRLTKEAKSLKPAAARAKGLALGRRRATATTSAAAGSLQTAQVRVCKPF